MLYILFCSAVMQCQYTALSTMKLWKRGVSTLKAFKTPSYAIQVAGGATKFAIGSDIYELSNWFLRDCSESARSVDPSSGQKFHSITQLARSAVPVAFTQLDGNRLKITWTDDDFTVVSPDFLKLHSPGPSQRPAAATPPAEIWQGNAVSTRPFGFAEYMSSDSVLAQVLAQLNAQGLSFIGSIPPPSSDNTEVYVQQIGERISYLKQTFYGTVFNVKSVPNAKNIAYTSTALHLHQDLLYYESPPGLQLLHFIKNECAGGENLFSDGFAAAQFVKQNDPVAYQALLKYPVNYHYTRDSEYYYYSHPVVVENADAQGFKEVNYSPQFQAPFTTGISPNSPTEDQQLFQDFLRGYEMFEQFINDPQNQLRLKMDENCCVIFNNRRLLHARDQFDSSGGFRWLQGCYLDLDSFYSKLRVHCTAQTH